MENERVLELLKEIGSIEYSNNFSVISSESSLFKNLGKDKLLLELYEMAWKDSEVRDFLKVKAEIIKNSSPEEENDILFTAIIIVLYWTNQQLLEVVLDITSPNHFWAAKLAKRILFPY